LRLVGLLLGVVAGSLSLLPAGAMAEPLCTDSWIGGSSGSWQTAANWSSGTVPGPSDVACIASGTVVEVSGVARVGVLSDGGSLLQVEGSLEIAGTSEASSVAGYTSIFGTLMGAGTLDVSSNLTLYPNSLLSGSGSTVVLASATASVAGKVAKRSLVNQGTMSVVEAGLYLSEGARLTNQGTFEAGKDIEGASSALFVNTGHFRRKAGSEAVVVQLPFSNEGAIEATTGELTFEVSETGSSASSIVAGAGAVVAFADGTFAQAGGTWRGVIDIDDFASVTSEGLLGESATVKVQGGTWVLGPGPKTTVAGFVLDLEGTVSGAGSLSVSGTFEWTFGTMAGSGTTVVEGSAAGILGPPIEHLERPFVNEGELTHTEGEFEMTTASHFTNDGRFVTDGESWIADPKGGYRAMFVNRGTFERASGPRSLIEPPFHNEGLISGAIFDFVDLEEVGSQGWGCSEEDPSFPKREVAEEDGVCTATGDLSESQSDLTVGGRGVGLNVTRTYNSQAAEQGAKSAFGYGWSSPYSQHLVFEPMLGLITLVQENGSTVTFEEGLAGELKSPQGSPDVLSGSSTTGYSLTLEDEDVYHFSGSLGRLESIVDRNENTTTLGYNTSGQLEKVTDPAGRTMRFEYNGEGLISAVVDPLHHEVKYTYEGENLKTVSEPGETALRWQFVYEGAHQLSEMIDGRGGKTKYEYSSAHQVAAKIDPMSRKTTFAYGFGYSEVTNEATGAVTMQYVTSAGQLAQVVHGFGTASATTESFTYDEAGDQASVTNGDGRTTKYGYDGAGDRTSMLDPEGHETKWTYDSTHDVETTTTPDGETTTTKRDSHGNPTTVERPAPGGATQVTTYKYDSHGDLESMTDPLKRTWKYEYDTAGDRTAEIDPEGDKRTWRFNEDSQETSMVSPRGHVTGAKEASFTTTTERDAQGRPTVVISPLKHETKYKYDADGNLESKTDPEGDTTTYTYDADNEQTKVKEPNGTVTETGYDGAGQVTSQTDGNKHTTTYVRNVLEQVTEVIDPLARKTLKEYDHAGNLIAVTDAEKRTTSYKYDPDNRVVEVSYSDGKTPAVEYEYNGDGDRTKMVDGTGTTSYEYDQLDRLTSTTDGHGDVVGYEYDLANEQTKITYPNGKAIRRSYDNAGRLSGVTDWLEHTTKFGYDADSDVTSTTFPSETADLDKYGYNETDAMSEVKYTKGSETLASIAYTRNKDDQVTKATTVGLPGEEKPAFAYDENSRITKGAGVAYKYDAANDPTTIGSDTYNYNAADELENSKLKTTTVATYTYDEVGERTKTAPASGPATTYGYNQAGDLVSVTRPKEGTTPAFEDTYAYNGDGLRTAQTVSGTTTYMAWDVAEKLPLILNDGTSSYVYGPGGLPVEQINNGTGTVLYLHHDQQGSTRLLTGSTGKTEGTFTYDAYGNKTGTTGIATSPLGYGGQYTDTGTGLIYLRARYYDPTTAQFVTVDPAVMETQEAYGYATEDPVDVSDPSGLCPSATTASLPSEQPASKSNCNKWYSEAKRKYNYLRTKENDLKDEGPSSQRSVVEGHVNAWNQKVKNLVELLKKFDKGGCEEEYDLHIPAEAYELASQKLEVKEYWTPGP
jgi:RHS repeat-associated protein